MTEDEIREKAIRFARANKKGIARKLTDTSKFPAEENPVTVFMAGSPGAGKTEASKWLLSELNADNVIRLDPDELRGCFEDYNGANSHLFQAAVSILVEKVIDLVLKNGQSILLDGTLGGDFDKCVKNIDRSLDKGRYVQIYYVYQEPLLAWDVVLKREIVEGRNIRAENFIDQYFGSRANVNQLKAKFGDEVRVDVLIKDYKGGNRKYKFNVQTIDSVIPEKYDRKLLDEIITID